MDETRDDTTYCEGAPVKAAAPAPVDSGPRRGVLCRRPTEYPESTRGSTLCPLQSQGQRTACSG